MHYLTHPLSQAMLTALQFIAAKNRRPTFAGKRTLAALARRGLLVWGRDWCSVTAAGRRVLADAEYVRELAEREGRDGR